MYAQILKGAKPAPAPESEKKSEATPAKPQSQPALVGKHDQRVAVFGVRK